MKLAFYFSVYQDELLAVRLATKLNKLYPTCQIIAVTDGDSRNVSGLAKLNFLCQLHVTKQRLKNKLGGAHTQRWLDIVCSSLDTDTDLLIKLDPDSYVVRQFKYYPDLEWFGQLYWNKVVEANACQGGCWGMRYYTLLQWCESGLLGSKVLEDMRFTYSKGRRKKTDDFKWVARESSIIAWCMRELGVVAGEWTDVFCTQSGEQTDTAYAVIHPNRTWW